MPLPGSLLLPGPGSLPGTNVTLNDLEWRPTVAQVAEVSPAYTRGGFDDDVPQAGAQLGRFTDFTSPTTDEVEGLITAACLEVEGRVGFEMPTRCYALAKITARWHVAAAISAGKIPAGTDDASGEYRSHITSYRACLDELLLQARQPAALRIC